MNGRLPVQMDRLLTFYGYRKKKQHLRSSKNSKISLKTNRIVYILAASHSGSTLLALLLGSHPYTCTIGELKATSLGDTDRYLCSCGKQIRLCSFWKEINSEVSRHGIPFDITDAKTNIQSNIGVYERFLLKPLHRGPILECLRDAALLISPCWRRHHEEVMLRNRLLVQAVCRAYNASMVIDSSKIGIRLKYLLRDPHIDVKVVRLIRDGRAVALTYMKPSDFADARDPNLRGGGNIESSVVKKVLSMKAAAYEWKRSNEEAEHILAEMNPSRYITVKYEDLCSNPNSELNRLFSFLGLDSSLRLKNYRAASKHVIGNGMRMDSISRIIFDERWRGVLTLGELTEFNTVAGKKNREYGYF